MSNEHTKEESRGMAVSGPRVTGCHRSRYTDDLFSKENCARSEGRISYCSGTEKPISCAHQQHNSSNSPNFTSEVEVGVGATLFMNLPPKGIDYD